MDADPDPAAVPAVPAVLEELVDVVDEDDRVIATVTRARMRAERLLHRAVFIAVRHPDGRLLVHQRSPDKDLWPGRWDLAVGGVVAAGETYDQAAVRELAEEIGVTGAVPVPVATAAFRDDDVALLARCYTVTTAGPFHFADGEVVAADWVDVAELGRWAATRTVVPDSLALLRHLVPRTSG